MNIGVTGHKGVLGRAVVQAVMKHEHVLRIFEEEGIRDWYNTSPPARRIHYIGGQELESIDTIINCAGRTSQRSGTEIEFIWDNAYSPLLLADHCDTARTRLIHISSDCVFSLPGPHTEASPISPKGTYGISKAAGEIFRPPHLTVRTSFVGWGPAGLMADLRQNEEVYASSRLLWSGHTVDTVAEYLVLLAERPDITGLLHMAGEWQNRYELCNRLNATFPEHLGAEVIRRDDFFADRRLLSNRWGKLDLPPIPSFDEQLKAMAV